MVTIQGTIEHMHWVERDGQQLPRRIGGHPALDFCNTLAGWGGPPLPKGEWLRTYDVFVGWAGYADLLDAEEEAALRGRSGARAEAVLDDARRLRGRLRTAVLDPSHARAMSDVGSGWSAPPRRACGSSRAPVRPGGSTPPAGSSCRCSGSPGRPASC